MSENKVCCNKCPHTANCISCQMMEQDPCKQLGWLLWMTPSRLSVCVPHSAQCKWVMRTTRPLASYPCCCNANLAHVLWPFAKLPHCGVDARLDLKHWAKSLVLVTKQKPVLLYSLTIVTSTWCRNRQIADSIYRSSVLFCFDCTCHDCSTVGALGTVNDSSLWVFLFVLKWPP